MQHKTISVYQDRRLAEPSRPKHSVFSHQNFLLFED